MALYLVLYLSLPIGLYVLGYLCGLKLRRLFIACAVFFLCSPVLVAILIFLLKNPIQRGKIFPQIGPLLNLVLPADDLFLPLASSPLDPKKLEYVLTFQHKYVGNHQLEISFPRIGALVSPKHNLQVSLTVTDGERTLLNQFSNAPTSYWGATDQGLIFISYRVPDNLPVSKTLNATTRVGGDIKSFVEKYGPATLTLRKGSDM